VTVWVGYRINKLGEVFLFEIFKAHDTIVKPLNMILLIGYYLLNIGAVFLMLNHNVQPKNLSEIIELLSEKIGTVVFSLGIIHLFNLLTFSVIYKIKSVR
jgi:hypothetical protein